MAHLINVRVNDRSGNPPKTAGCGNCSVTVVFATQTLMAKITLETMPAEIAATQAGRMPTINVASKPFKLLAY